MEGPEAHGPQGVSDEPRLPAEGLLAERVGREDGEGAEEARAQEEREEDALPRGAEERRDHVSDQEGEPGKEGRPGILIPERIVQHRVLAEVASALEGITEGAVPVVRFRPAGIRGRVDAVAVDIRELVVKAVAEIDAQKQRESEDEDQDRGGPPVRAEPAFTFVQALAN